MQKIVIDTNVLVAALIARGYPNLVLNHSFTNKNIELCYSESLFLEYQEVLLREKFATYEDFHANAINLLIDIELLGKQFYPTVKLEVIKDLDDNKLLELTVTAKADFLITGNQKDFTMQEFRGTKIITPKAYWNTYKI